MTAAAPSAPDPIFVAEVYRATFAPRYDCYAEWLVVDGCQHGDQCQCHWYSQKSELTLERIVEALRSPRPVSAYMEAADGSTHVGAIDFDREDGWALGLAVAKVIRAEGGHPYLEKSRRGCHLWVVLDDIASADTVRLGLRYWVSQVNQYLTRDPKVEILPKRLEQRGPTTVGSPLRMPMMAHQRTGKRSPLYDADGVAIGASISDVLTRVEFTPAAIVRAAASRARIPAEEIRVQDWARKPAQEGGDVIALLTQAGVQRAVPGRTVRCVLHDDRMASMSISREGERVWCKAPTCVAHNGGRGLGADQLAKALGVNAE